MSFPNYAPPSPASADGSSPQSLSYAAPSMDSIPLTPGGLEMLRQTRPWVLFISIVLSVLSLLLLLGGAAGMAFASMHRRASTLPVFGAYILVGVIYMIPAGYLRKYAGRIRQLMNAHSAEDLEAALEAQKSFWRVVGILMAIGVALYAIVLFGALTSVGMSRMFR